MNPTAIILSGGKSSRMGQDKALLPFWGKPIIKHVLKNLLKLTNKVIISANSHDYAFIKQPQVPDIYKEQGPLAGIHASLKATKTGFAFIATCDVPLVSPELYLYLLENHVEGLDAVVAVHKGQVHPLIGIYSKANIEKIERALEQGKRSVIHYLKDQNVRYVEIDSSLPFYSEHLFLNLNSPEEYQKLLLMEAGIRVLYFGITGDISGKPEEFFSEITNVADLKSELFTNYPKLKEQPFKISVNQVFANDSFRLREGDEIALLPPFAGG